MTPTCTVCDDIQVLPIQHLEYIERAVDSLLEPVVAGVNRLRPSAQLEALTTVITDICDAWTANILTKKIRFRWLLEAFVRSLVDGLLMDKYVHMCIIVELGAKGGEWGGFIVCGGGIVAMLEMVVLEVMMMVVLEVVVLEVVMLVVGVGGGSRVDII